MVISFSSLSINQDSKFWLIFPQNNRSLALSKKEWHADYTDT
jgi:hypothetical protein